MDNNFVSAGLRAMTRDARGRHADAPPCPLCRRPMTLSVERERGTCVECKDEPRPEHGSPR